MLISLTVGKVDAGVAVLLTEDKRLVCNTPHTVASCWPTSRYLTPTQIEFPSILLPPSITSGSIVDITVARNFAAEATSQKAFSALQDNILRTYGERSPSAPILRCRNATQTSLVLEWDPIELATADLRTLTLFRNGSRAGGIPRPLEMTSTKISGLAVDTEYTFHLVLKTSAGTYSSEKLVVKTHKMTDLSGITVTPGILPAQLKTTLINAVERIGAKLADTVRIDTTHFVCTEGRGQPWEKAVEMNIPVVRPEWVEGCEREGRIVGVRGYYLNANPKDRQIGQGVGAQQHQQPSRVSGDSTNLPSRGAVSSPPPASVEAMRSPIRGPEVPPKDAQLADSPAQTPTTEESQEDEAPVGDEKPRHDKPSESEDEEEYDEKKTQGGSVHTPEDSASMATTLKPEEGAGDGQRTPEGMEEVEL
jgi:chitin biosynthesis protein CHS5